MPSPQASLNSQLAFCLVLRQRHQRTLIKHGSFEPAGRLFVTAFELLEEFWFVDNSRKAAKIE
jgi:hypothetical protein